jgi:hypothetical protein
MQDEIKAALLLWIPLAIASLGIAMQFRRQHGLQNLGKGFLIIGLGFYLASFLTVPESPSSASSALFVAILPALLLIFIGLFIATFSGETPVRRFNPKFRSLGLLMFICGFALLEWMNWHESNWLPSLLWKGETNKYWLIFRPTFLLSMCSILLFGSYVVKNMGGNKNDSSRNLFIVSVFSFALLLLGLYSDNAYTTTSQFSTSLWLATSDLLGILAGLGLSVTVFTLAIWYYERKRPGIDDLPPPSDKQLNFAAKVIRKNLGGEESE